jgi:pentatricopeptide repeat protein
VGNLPKAIDIYNEILDRTIRGEPHLLNNYIFGTMLNVCSMANNLVKAEEVFADIPKHGMVPDIVAYGTIINLCMNLKEKDIANKYFAMMKEKNVDPNAYILASMRKLDPEAFPENRTVSGRRPLSASMRSPRDRLTATWGGSDEGAHHVSFGELRRMRSYENVKRGSYDNTDASAGFSRNRSFEHVRSEVEPTHAFRPVTTNTVGDRPLSATNVDNWRSRSQGGGGERSNTNREKLSQSERPRANRTQSEKPVRPLQNSQRKMGDNKRGVKRASPPKGSNSARVATNLKGSSGSARGGQVWARKSAPVDAPSDSNKNTQD